MCDDTIYPLRDVARQLELPESTVRDYRDASAAYIPVLGLRRRRRYPPEAVEILRDIAHYMPATAVTPQASTTAHDSHEFISAWVEGEHERREVMWQMVQEIVRLDDAVERQHVILGSIVEQLAGSNIQALPANSSTTIPDVGEASPSPRTAVDLRGGLKALQDELARERESVERLRRGKLERRAAAAETLLEAREQGALGGSIIARFRSRPRREQVEEPRGTGRAGT